MAFMQLPVEIVGLIAEQLTAQGPVPGQFSDPKLLQYKKECWEPSHTGLTSLCLVSKKYSKEAQRHLYRHVTFPNFRSLVRLYRTIREDPSIAGLIKRFNLEIQLSLEGFTRIQDHSDLRCPELDQMVAVCQGLARRESQRHDRLATTAAAPMEDHNIWLGCLLIRILTQTQSLTELTLRLPKHPTWSHIEAHLALTTSYNIRKQFGPLLHIIESRRSPGTDRQPILPELSTVHLLGPYDAQVWGLLQHAGKLHTFKSTRDKGHWRDLGQFNQTRHLELLDSYCRPYDVNDICKSFPTLETLVIKADHTWANVRASLRIPSLPHVDLTAGLRTLKNLQTIVLDIHATRYYPHKLRDNHQLGPQGYLSLADLPHLRKIHLPVAFVVHRDPQDHLHTPAWKASYPHAPPAAILPPSMEHLTLSAFVEDYDRPTRRLRKATMAFIGSLLTDSLHNFPRLKSVTYVYRSGNPSACFCVDGLCPRGCPIHSDGEKLYSSPFLELEDLVEKMKLQGITLSATEEVAVA